MVVQVAVDCAPLVPFEEFLHLKPVTPPTVSYEVINERPLAVSPLSCLEMMSYSSLAPGVLSTLIHASIVQSPVGESDALSTAEKYCDELRSKSAEVVSP